jgi:hypothetical protein
MLKLGSKYINPNNVAVVYEDTIIKSAIDDSTNGRSITKHSIPVAKLILNTKETLMLEDVTTEIVIREFSDYLPFAFVHIGDRFVNPKYITSVEDVTINRTIVDNDEIKPGESVVVSGHQTFTVVDIYGVEYMRVDGTDALPIYQAIEAALDVTLKK